MRRSLFILCGLGLAVLSAGAAEEGTEASPWTVGESVTAWLDSSGVLRLTGSGATYGYVAPSDVPWKPSRVRSVLTDPGVVPGANVFAALPESVKVNGLTIARQTAIAASAGVTPGSRPEIPAGAIIVRNGEAEIRAVAETEPVLATNKWTQATLLGAGFDETAREATLVVPADGARRFYRVKTKRAE